VEQAMKFLISKVLEVSSRVQLEAHKLPSHNSAALSVVSPESGGRAAAGRALGETQKKESCEC
jgi:hypothetical protein